MTFKRCKTRDNFWCRRTWIKVHSFSLCPDEGAAKMVWSSV